jgi:hypothetical protein
VGGRGATVPGAVLVVGALTGLDTMRNAPLPCCSVTREGEKGSKEQGGVRGGAKKRTTGIKRRESNIKARTRDIKSI